MHPETGYRFGSFCVKCKDFPLTDDQIQDAMHDNPSDQGDQLPPLILIRPEN